MCRLVRKQGRDGQALNRRVTSVKVINIERTMIEVRKRFPSVGFMKSVSPMNKIEGLTTNVLEIQDGIDKIFNVAFNNNFKGRRKRFFLGGEVGGFVWSKEGFVKDRMKMRPRGRKVQLVGGGANALEDAERAITFGFQFLRRVMRDNIGTL